MNEQLAPTIARINELKAVLIAEAGQSPHKTELPSGGWTVDYASQTAAVVTVTQPGDSLLSEVNAETAASLHAIAARKFNKLFTAFYRPVKNFRVEAWKHLDRAQAAKLIAAVEVPSKARVTIA